MRNGRLLAKAFERNARIIRAQAEGLTHADSLAQSPHNINCFNWVLGHVLDSREEILELLGNDRSMTAEEIDRYTRESNPVTEDGPGVIPFDRLLEMLATGQETIGEKVGGLTEEDLAGESIMGDRTVTLLQRLHFMYFHDTYHTGQTEIGRQVAGKNDKVI